jgi:peptide/nickel transport system substrate-binding protein
VVVHDPRALKSQALVGALLLALVLSGCGNLDATGGQELVMARVKDAINLDPSHATDGQSLNVDSEILEGLVRFKPGTFDVTGALAQSWSVSPDGTRWTFRLRPGMRFSDGTPVDAAAVKFDFDRWRLQHDPYHAAFSYAYWVSEFGGFSDDPKNPGVLRDVIVDAPLRVTFVLAQPSGTFLRNLAMQSFLIGSPAAIKRDPFAFEQHPIGSGPYVLREWVRDDHITLDANPAYTGSGPRAAIRTVVIRDIPDQATSVLSIEKGELQMLTDVGSDDAAMLGAQRGVTIVRQPSNNLAYLAMNMEKKPFDNLLVRRAVAEAIDIPAIIRALYGPGTVPGNNWTPPGMLGENPHVKIWPHDVAVAKRLLAQAGFPHGFATTLYLPTTPRPYMPDPQRLAEAIQADLKQAGIDVTLEPLEFGVFLAKIQNGEHPMCLIGWSGDNGDPDNFYYPLLDQDSAVKPFAQNYSFWRDPVFHRLMLAGQRSVNDTQRRAIYRQAAQLVHDQVPAIPLLHTPVPLALRTSVHGFVPSPDTEYHFELMTTGT